MLVFLGSAIESGYGTTSQNPAIPAKMKTAAKNWINNQITDNQFLAIIQQLVTNGTLVLANPQTLPSSVPANTNMNCTSAPSPGINWSGCDITGRILSKVILSGADLSGAKLK